ncbi:MAG: ribosomal RNA small subunit methyltransferase A [Candidatus Moranbacteria bacterium]|nr:ribosomal RNA small subunit methyltransferase A [Candidatus Moranbacteria bacterium]
MEIKKILKKLNIKPSKELGQNFLLDGSVLDRIVESAKIEKNETVLEIGPGLGFLTDRLIEITNRLILVEKDKRLFKYLENKYKNVDELTMINDDILKLNLSKILPNRYKVVANIPYNITSRIIYLLIETKPRAESITLLVQKEVAEKIVPKKNKQTPLSLLVKLLGKGEIIANVNKSCFFPIPKIDSAIVQISNIDQNLDLTDEANKSLLRLIKIGFSSPRKKLVNNLANGLGLDKAKIEQILKDLKIEPKVRAEELGIGFWKEFGKSLSLD